MVDLHLHSSASDGRHPPHVVVRLAQERGLEVIALTDHDSVEGVAPAREAARSAGVRVISGCEFSVRASWGEMHLLAYYVPDHGVVGAFLVEQRERRLRRAERIVERLRALHVDVALDDVLSEAAGGAVGRPHVARTLVRLGVTGDIQEAFRRYLGWRRPAFVAKELPEVATVTALIRSVGGVTSAAHLGERATASALERLKGQGLDAVEVLHPGHDAAVAQRIDALAERVGLLRTGGSDWHGEDEATGNRAALGTVAIPEPWLDALDALHRSRTSTTEHEG